MRVTRYTAEIERVMKALFDSLAERDRRRYAAAEAIKLGHGGVCYLAGLLGGSERTIRRRIAERTRLPQPTDGRVRRKGGRQAPHGHRCRSGRQLPGGPA